MNTPTKTQIIQQAKRLTLADAGKTVARWRAAAQVGAAVAALALAIRAEGCPAEVKFFASESEMRVTILGLGMIEPARIAVVGAKLNGLAGGFLA